MTAAGSIYHVKRSEADIDSIMQDVKGEMTNNA